MNLKNKNGKKQTNKNRSLKKNAWHNLNDWLTYHIPNSVSKSSSKVKEKNISPSERKIERHGLENNIAKDY